MDKVSASRAREGDGRVSAPPDINPPSHFIFPEPDNPPVKDFSTHSHLGVTNAHFDAFEKSFYNPTESNASAYEHSDALHHVTQNVMLNSERINAICDTVSAKISDNYIYSQPTSPMVSTVPLPLGKDLTKRSQMMLMPSLTNLESYLHQIQIPHHTIQVRFLNKSLKRPRPHSL